MRRVIVDIDDYGDEIVYCLEQDGIPYDYNEIANSKVNKARKEIRNLTSQDNYMVDVDDVLEILDKLTDSEEDEE